MIRLVLLMALNCFAGNFALSTAAAGNTIDVTNAAMAGINTSSKAAILFIWSGRTATGQGEADLRLGSGYAVSATDRGGATCQSDHGSGTSATDSQVFDDACIKVLTITGSVEGAIDFNSYITNGFRLIIDDAFLSAYLIGFIAIWGDDLTVASSVTVTEPGATGNQDTTLTGFTANATDQCLFVWGASDAAMNTSTGQSAFMFGAAAGATPDNAVVAGAGQDAQGTSVTWSYCKLGEFIGWCGGAADAVSSRGAVTAWLANAFRINWTEVSATAAPVFRVLGLKGGRYKLFDALTQTSTGTFTETGVGFTSIGQVVASHCQVQSTADTVQAVQECTIGFAYGTGTSTVQAQVSVGAIDTDAAPTIDCGIAFDTSNVYLNQSTATTIVIEGTMATSSFDSDGYTFNMTDADPAQSFFWGVGIAGNAVTFTPTEPSFDCPMPRTQPRTIYVPV